MFNRSAAFTSLLLRWIGGGLGGFLKRLDAIRQVKNEIGEGQHPSDQNIFQDAHATRSSLPGRGMVGVGRLEKPRQPCDRRIP